MQGASRSVPTRHRGRRTRRGGLTAAAAAGLVASGLVLQAVPAVAASSSPSSTTGPVTYTSGTGPSPLCPAGTYVVPAGTRYVQVVATGGAGSGGGTYSANSTGGPGGNGAQVTTILPVSAGQSLTVVVGRPGSSTDSYSGWPDGGANSFNLGQGGGSSYVTTQPLFPNSGCKDGASNGLTPPTVMNLDRKQMLVLAGGGGGGGGSSLFGSGGSGGNAGANADLSGQGGSTAYHLDSDCGQGGGAGGGSASGPGTYGPGGCAGADNGSVGRGFYGADASDTATTGTSAGGAGGGGWYGGGSGGSGTGLGGGGGGAGSSYVTPTARSVSIAQASPVGGTSVTITPQATPTTTAATAGGPLVNWYTAQPRITLTADPAGGAAVDKTYYAVDNPNCGDATRGSCQLYTGPFDVPAGLHTLTYFSVNARNLDGPLQTRSFAVTPTSASATAAVTASGLGSGTNPTASASGPVGAPGSVSVTGSGTGAVGAAVYGSNPAGAPVFTSSGAFVDVLVSGSTLTGATITDCNLNGGTSVSWWDGSTWTLASNQTYDPVAKCVTVTVTGTTKPSVSQLTGTVLAAGRPPTTTAVATTADGKPYVAGTWTNQSVTVAFTCSPNATASAPVTLAGDRANQSATGTCTDGVGQRTSTTFTGVDVDKSAPTCSTTVDPSVLWPANSKAVAIKGTVLAGDALSGVARVVGSAVTSNETLTAGDVQGFAVNSAYPVPLQAGAVVPDPGQLKATRNGNGTGRTYTQAFTVTDQAGNTNATRCTWTVTVPHDQGSGR